MWEEVKSPGNEQDLPRRGCRFIRTEVKGRNPGKHKEEVYLPRRSRRRDCGGQAEKRASRRKAGQIGSSQQAREAA